MGLKLVPVAESDGPLVTNVYIRAFHNDAFNQRLFPDMTIEKKIEGANTRWPGNYSNPCAIYRMIVDEDTNQVVSYSKWEIKNEDQKEKANLENKEADAVDNKEEPDASTVDGNTAEEPSEKKEVNSVEDADDEADEVWPEGINCELCTEFSDEVIAVCKSLIGDRPQMLLKMLGTLPEYQGRGAGAMHLEWAAKIADEKGLVSYLDASPAGLKLYQRFGYEAQGQVTTDLERWGAKEGSGKYTHVCMVREPKTGITIC